MGNKSVAEVIFFQVAGPSPGSIGVGERPQVFPVAPTLGARVGRMGIARRSVSGKNRKGVPLVRCGFQGEAGQPRDRKKRLQAAFKVKREILPAL